MAGNKRAKRDLQKQQKAGKYTAGAEGIMATYGNKRLKATRGDRETPPAKAVRVQEDWQKKAGGMTPEQHGAVVFNDRRQEGRRDRPS